MTSPFLDRPCTEWVASNGLVLAVRDLHPVSPGHALVVPFRLVVTWFDASHEEKTAIADDHHQDTYDDLGRSTGPMPRLGASDRPAPRVLSGERWTAGHGFLPGSNCGSDTSEVWAALPA